MCSACAVGVNVGAVGDLPGPELENVFVDVFRLALERANFLDTE